MRSAFEVWHDDRELRRAIALQIRYGDPVEPHRVLRAITLRCRTPTIFRPCVARFIYERYCPSGGIAWDPCAGYGGRLLGAAAAGIRYLGTDVEPETVDGNRQLATQVGVSVEVHIAAAESFESPRVDLVFTSPPYFDRERYSMSEAQSWRRHGKDFESWLGGFLSPMIERARGALPAGGYLLLNVADLRERRRAIPVVARTIEVATEIGFAHVETLRIPLAAINRSSPSEPLLVFRKA